jgi:hypothetical protein
MLKHQENDEKIIESSCFFFKGRLTPVWPNSRRGQQQSMCAKNSGERRFLLRRFLLMTKPNPNTSGDRRFLLSRFLLMKPNPNISLH